MPRLYWTNRQNNPFWGIKHIQKENIMNARSGLHSKTLFNLVIIALLLIALAVVSVQTVSARDTNGGGYPTKTPTPRKHPRRTPTPTAIPACENAFTFVGQVFDQDTGEGLSYNVVVGGAFPAVFAGGPHGLYSVNVPAGWGCYINGIAVRADGYEPYFLPYNVEQLIVDGWAPSIGLVRENYTPTPTATPPFTETPGPYETETPTPFFPTTTGTPTATATP
jgi:hypothetical protein